MEMTEEQKRVLDDGKGKGKAVDEPAMSQENAQLLAFCRRIVDTAKAIDRFLTETKGAAFVERLHASLPKVPTATAIAAYLDENASEAATQRAYLDWAMQARFVKTFLKPTSNTYGHL